jgi:hypothetical protein
MRLIWAKPRIVKVKDLKILSDEAKPLESNYPGCSKRGRTIRFSG